MFNLLSKKLFMKKNAILLIITGFILSAGCKKDELTVTDSDGNTYRTISIGGKTWMAEDLRTTKFNDGTSIPLVTSNNSWTGLKTAGYCEVNNDAANASLYGRLYNWYAVTDSRKLCPSGWHVPTLEEVNALVSALGGTSVAGGKLKEKGTTFWNTPNTGATNESGFSARGAGYRSYLDGTYKDFRYVVGYWTSTSHTSLTAYHKSVWFNNAEVEVSGKYNTTGLLVRCVKN